jgi:hypothetical protein
MTTSGWTIGQSDLTLPFRGDLPTTIAAANAIRAVCASALPPSACTALLNSLAAVETSLTTYAYTNALERGLIAGYFTALRDTPPIPIATIGSMVDLLLFYQSTNGSWEDDIFSTTTALHALAKWLRLDRADAPTPVSIANAGLRAAVNRSLGHHAMDAVTRGDLWRLTTLDLSYASTGSDLSALSQAQNVTTLDISGNPCLLPLSDTALRGFFPQLTTITRHPAGDVNRDASANGYDQRLLVSDLMKRSVLVGTGRRAADLNFDGQLDSRDLYWLARVLAKRDVSQLCQ